MKREFKVYLLLLARGLVSLPISLLGFILIPLTALYEYLDDQIE